MSTSMYLNNRAEIAAAAKAARALTYQTSIADIQANDRYVVNIVERLAGMSTADRRELEAAIVDAVEQVRL